MLLQIRPKIAVPRVGRAELEVPGKIRRIQAEKRRKDGGVVVDEWMGMESKAGES